MRKRDPRSKEELLDRMLSYDFDGDIRHLGAQPASIVRQGPNRLLLAFPDSGKTFELEVHIPRDAERRSFATQAEPQEEWAAETPAPTRRRQPRAGTRQSPARPG